jgi:hypothetical protein
MVPSWGERQRLVFEVGLGGVREPRIPLEFVNGI